MDSKENKNTPPSKEEVLGEKIKKPTDWLGFAVIISAVLIGGFFILQNINAFNAGNEAQEKVEQVKSEYQKNVNDPNNTPEAVYEQARQALLNNDLEGVLDTIHPEVMWRYEENIQAFYDDGDMYVLAERMTPLKEVLYEYENVIEYSIEPIPGNDSDDPLERFTQSIEFTRNNKGIWKISSI